MKQFHIRIYGSIESVQSPEAGQAYGFVCAKMISDQLASMPNDTKEIVVHIHSPGGEVFEGFAIHDLLRNAKKPVTTIVEGLCASIATVIALAGDTRQMTKNSKFMIHNPWGMAAGDADQLEKYADQCRDAEDQIANFYAEKTGNDIDEIKDWMKQETFMTAQQALDYGFITDEPLSARLSLNAMIDRPSTNKKLVYAKISKKHKTMKTKKTSKKVNKTPVTTEDKFDKFMNTIAEALGVKKKKVVASATKKVVKKKVVAAIDMTDTDGNDVSIDTSESRPGLGDAVTVNGEAAPSATINLDDNTVIETDADSNIISIETAEEEAAEPAAAVTNKSKKKVVASTKKKKVASNSKEIEALKAENKTLKVKVKNRDIRVSRLEKKMDTFMSTVGSKFMPDGEDKGKMRKVKQVPAGDKDFNAALNDYAKTRHKVRKGAEA